MWIRRGTRKATGPTLVAAALAVGTAMAGCEAAPATRSGPDAPPLELVLANADSNLDGAPAVQRFVDRLEELSAGRVQMRVERHWGEEADEARVLRDVAAGKAELGWSGTRAVDLVGVDAFTPLHAPFLVNSFEAERAVVADPEITGLLGRLDEAGLAGLALLSDELRFPVGTDGPLLTPADYQGARISSYPSAVQSEGLAALAAVPTDEFVQEGMGPPVDGFETMWWTYQVRGLCSVATSRRIRPCGRGRRCSSPTRRSWRSSTTDSRDGSRRRRV